MHESPGPSSSKKVWLAPNPGELKLNVDGVIFSDQNRTGVGCVLQDERGSVLMGATKREELRGDPLEIDLMLTLFRGL